MPAPLSKLHCSRLATCRCHPRSSEGCPAGPGTHPLVRRPCHSYRCPVPVPFPTLRCCLSCSCVSGLTTVPMLLSL